jgi:hypothetical protein
MTKVPGFIGPFSSKKRRRCAGSVRRLILQQPTAFFAALPGTEANSGKTIKGNQIHGRRGILKTAERPMVSRRTHVSTAVQAIEEILQYRLDCMAPVIST